MPTYSVITANVHLSPGQEADIASAITQAHHDHTGAPGFFAQTIFSSLGQGSHYIGGKPNRSPHIFVHGMIRDGRPEDLKSRLISDICERVRSIAALSNEDVWVYVQDIPAAQMIEFGRILPEPGSEVEWRKGISPRKLSSFTEAGVEF